MENYARVTLECGCEMVGDNLDKLLGELKEHTCYINIQGTPKTMLTRFNRELSPDQIMDLYKEGLI